jgi:hypothetical protein
MLRLRIDTDNDAFADGWGPAEVARLLRIVSIEVECGDKFDGVIRDSNGNTCGQWDLRFERSQEEDTDA